MDIKELEQIIENHRHWLDEDVDDWEYMCADLSDADLSDADLSGANLHGANLSGANLSGADLSGADLSGAILSNANLSRADLRDTNLRGTNLRFADLSGADLSGAILSGAILRFADLRCAKLSEANLSKANLRDTNLRDANLRFADLKGADLSGADLSEANLRGANLWGANLKKAKNVPYIPMICPEEGSFIGYKKASGKIVKLCIPEDAKRSSATTRKCRCNKAIVLGIYELDGTISSATEVQSNYDSNFIYKINKEVVVDNFNDDRWNECSTGIHFFMQRHEAVEYQS